MSDKHKAMCNCIPEHQGITIKRADCPAHGLSGPQAGEVEQPKKCDCGGSYVKWQEKQRAATPAPAGDVEEQLSNILMALCARVERIPRGKTYGWSDEQKAIMALFTASQPPVVEGELHKQLIADMVAAKAGGNIEKLADSTLALLKARPLQVAECQGKMSICKCDGFWHVSVKDSVHGWRAVYLDGVEAARQQSADSPMGVSAWIEHGKKYGYYDFAVKQSADEVRREVENSDLKAVIELLQTIQMHLGGNTGRDTSKMWNDGMKALEEVLAQLRAALTQRGEGGGTDGNS